MNDEFQEREITEVTSENRPELLYVMEVGLEDHFNAAAWMSEEEGLTILLARYLKQAAEWGEADKGALVLDYDRTNFIPTELTKVEIQEDKVVREEQVWSPEGKETLLEDPRAIHLPDGRILIGLTGVRKNAEGKIIPFAALMYLESPDKIGQIREPDYQIIENLGPGKNFTPIDAETFLFRKEGDENNHKLCVIGWDERKRVAFEKGVIEMPADLEWASYRIGTVMPPIWLDDEKKVALMVFHGSKKEVVVDGNGRKKERYDYALGKAILRKDDNGNLFVNKEEVGREPIFTRDDAVVDGQLIEGELHPERRVVYCCGGVVEQKDQKKVLALFVNVGDVKTVKVGFSMDKLTNGLRKAA